MTLIREPALLNKTGEKMVDALRDIRNVLETERKGGTIYGFHIDGAESDPSAKVTYIMDAIGHTPAHMNYQTDAFDYGSWRDAFFMPKPCMLKSNGEVAYYLNPNDFTKKEDGTASDVSNEAFDGNAMIEWGQNNRKIWYKIEPDSGDATSASVYIADYQADPNFKCWSFLDKNGDEIDHFYTPIYNGFSDSNNKMRSLSGKTPTASLSGSVEMTRCRANGADIWDTEVYCDHVLIALLLILMGKSTDSQTVFGQGNTSGGQSGVLNTGTMDTKGMFWGSSGTTSGVKVFGMENPWGNLWRRTAGLVNVTGTQKYKMTRSKADGTGVADYVVSNTASDYNGYRSSGSLPSASGTYISKMTFDENQMSMTEANGTSATYYCDGLWTNNGATCYALVGGGSNASVQCGLFSCSLARASSFASWDLTASVSCKPLA